MIDHLWTHAPELRRRARRQAWSLRMYQGFAREPRWADVSFAWDIGSRAGKLMALRIEAYDRLQAALTASPAESEGSEMR